MCVMDTIKSLDYSGPWFNVALDLNDKIKLNNVWNIIFKMVFKLSNDSRHFEMKFSDRCGSMKRGRNMGSAHNHKMRHVFVFKFLKHFFEKPSQQKVITTIRDEWSHVQSAEW
jgi:hypothetical protein